MKETIFPPFLKVGDKAVIVSPSGHVDSGYIDRARNVLESWGLRVEVAPHARNRHGRFSGTVEQRLSDLQAAMDDATNRLIFCSRGGYGAVHLLENLDFSLIKQVPKWLVGYSDITALHQLFASNGLVSLHAPMARHLAENTESAATVYLRETLFGTIPAYSVGTSLSTIDGVAEGMLFGGNMAVFCSLLASPYVKYAVRSGGILFLEDIGERPYQIDRMLWSLKLSGLLGNIKGLIMGSFTGCEEDPQMYQPVYESIRQMTEAYGIPFAAGFPVGHTEENYPLLHGSAVRLEVAGKKVRLTEI